MESLRRRIGSFCAGFLPVFLFSLSFAQTPELVLKASPATVAPQEPLTITISSNVPGTINVDYPVEFVSDYGTVDGMEQRLDPSTGRIITSHYLQQSGRFGKKGVYKFRASLKYHGKLVYSNYLTVTVRDALAPSGNAPVSLNNEPIVAVLEMSKSVVYEGEAVLMRPKVYSKLDLRRFDNYSAPKPDAVVESHPFEQVNFELHRIQMNGKPVNTFEYGKELLFPVTVGTITFSQFEMLFEYQSDFFLKPIKAKSRPVALRIKPLPAGAPATFIGGVGKFSLTADLEKTALKQGEVITLECRISGVGNLQNLEEPKLALPSGFQLYGDADRTENYTFTEHGAEGEIVYKIHVQVMKSGRQTFPGTTISWFNPATGKYESQSTESVELQVAVDTSFKSQTILQGTPGAIKFDKPGTVQTNWKLILLIAVGGLLILTALFFFLRRKTGKSTIETKVQQPQTPAIDGDKKELKAASEEPDYWSQLKLLQDDPEQFATLLPKAIAQRLNRKLGTDLSRLMVLDLARTKKPEAVTQLEEIIAQCEQYRYGFGDVSLNVPELLKSAEKVLSVL